MSEGKDSDNKQYSRREFLKLLGIGATSIAVTRLLTGCEKFTPKEMNLAFREVQNGDQIPFKVSGRESPVNVGIQYANSSVDRLQIRQDDNVDKAAPFVAGNETVRLLGEISDPKLYKVTGYNSELSINRVGVYPTVLGNKREIEGRQELSELGELYAIKTIVSGDATRGYGIENPPLEINKSDSFSNSDWRNVPDFGQGLAVGRFDSQNTFTMYGFVCDARAVNLE